MADRRSLLFVVFSMFLLFVIPGVSSEICAPENKDVKVLKQPDLWQFEVSRDLPGCKPFHPPGVNASTTCLFYFSLCKPVPDLCPTNSGICLTNKIDYGPKYKKIVYTKPENIGSFIAGPEAFKSEQKYFTLNFLPVNQLNVSHLVTTMITFTCNRSAKWGDPKDAEAKVPFPPSVNYTIEPGVLTYQIEFQYKGACPGGGGGGDDGGGGDGEPTKPLSVGSILLILFFPGIFLYCVVGVLINRGAGKTGKEMIPNSKFWTDLPGLISDGFSFFIAKITCSEMSTSQETYDRM